MSDAYPDLEDIQHWEDSELDERSEIYASYLLYREHESVPSVLNYLRELTLINTELLRRINERK